MKTTLLHVALLLVFSVVARADEVDSIPLVGDETVLARIQADPISILGQQFILAGGVTVSTYFNYGYDNAEMSHYSFRFKEVIKSSPIEVGGDCYLYLRRSSGNSIVESIIDRSGGSPAKFVRARVKAMLDPKRFDGGRSSSLLELLDIQFYSDKEEQWLPWIIETANIRREKETADANARADEEVRMRKAAVESQKKQDEINRARERTRTWKDSSGEFSVEAEFRGMLNDVVRLKRVADGKEITVRLQLLSDDDKEWIRKLRKR